MKAILPKEGDMIPMYFHYIGIKSQEDALIVRVEKRFVYLENPGEKPWKFDMATGQCVNDCTFEGGYRTIDKLM